MFCVFMFGTARAAIIGIIEKCHFGTRSDLSASYKILVKQIRESNDTCISSKYLFAVMLFFLFKC